MATIYNDVRNINRKEEANLSPRTGRPLKDNSKDTVLRVRVDNDTLRELDECVDKLSSDRSKVIRLGISKVKKSLENKKRREKEPVE